MTHYYIGFARGKVAHISKPGSWNGFTDYRSKLKTYCGRSYSTNWFSAGLDIYGYDRPANIPVCKQCQVVFLSGGE